MVTFWNVVAVVAAVVGGAVLALYLFGDWR